MLQANSLLLQWLSNLPSALTKELQLQGTLFSYDFLANPLIETQTIKLNKKNIAGKNIAETQKQRYEIIVSLLPAVDGMVLAISFGASQSLNPNHSESTAVDLDCGFKSIKQKYHL